MFADKLIDIRNVGAGKTAVITCPIGPTFDKIKLHLSGGLTAADITLIEGKANGRRFFVETGTNAIKRQNYKGVLTDSNFITLDFTEPKARGGAPEQYLASIPSNLLRQLTFEITIAPTANPASTIDAHAEVRNPTANPYIRKQLDFNQSVPAGEAVLFLPTGVSGGIVKRIWLHSADIQAHDLRVNGHTVMRLNKAELEYGQKENGIVPQAGIYVVDFVADGNVVSGALDTQKGQNVELRLTMAAAGSVFGYLEYIDPIGRL